MGRVRVLLAGFGVVVLWASAFPAIRVAAPELGVVGLPFARLAIAAGFFGERMTLLKLLGSAVAIGGVALVTLGPAGLTVSNAIGIIVAAAVVQGIHHPLTKPLLRRYTGLEVATYGMVGGAAMLLPALPFGWSSLVSASAAAWASTAYLGLLPSALGFVLLGYAVARLSVSASTSLLYLVPPVAVLIAFV